MIDLNLFFDHSRNVAMAAKFWAKLANAPSFGVVAFWIDKLGPVTSDITRLQIVIFGMIQHKLAYPTEYLRKCQTDLHQIFRVSRHMGGYD